MVLYGDGVGTLVTCGSKREKYFTGVIGKIGTGTIGKYCTHTNENNL